MVEQLTALCRLYVDASKEASLALWRNPLLIIGTALSCFIYSFSASIIGGQGFFGGMVVGLVQLFFISVAYCWLRDSVSHERLRWKGLYQLDGALFSSIINTGFVLFLAKFFLSVFVQSSGNGSLMLVLQLGLILICNSLPEVLYIQRSDGIEAIKNAAQFTRENWIEWFLPFFVLVIPWLLVSPQMLLILLAKMDELLPATIVYQSLRLFSSSFLPPSWLSSLVNSAVGVIALVWYMLFRGFLFKALSMGSRRTRVFLSKQRR